MNRIIAIVVAAAALAASGFAATKTATTTTLTISPTSPIQLGTQVTLTARVNPTTVTGTVTFYSGVRVLGIATVSGGSAALKVTDFAPTPQAAPYVLTATYNSDSNNAASTSLAVNLTVTAVQSSVFVPATFTPPQVTTAGAPSRTLQADFNHDGIMDLAIYGPNGIVIAMGNATNGTANGTFTLATSGAVLTGSTACLDLAVADFDGDGNPDLACYRRAMTSIDVFLGNGDGTFQTPSSLGVPATGNLIGELFGTVIVVADFNGDGLVDLAVPAQTLTTCPYFDGISNVQEFCYIGTVNTFPGNGDGTFQAVKSTQVIAPTAFSAQGLPTAMVGADLNVDGKTDVMLVGIAPSGGYDLYFLPGHGDGAFTTATGSLGAPGFGSPDPSELLAGNFTGQSGNPVQVLYRDGNGGIHVAIPAAGAGNVSFTYAATTPTNAKNPNGFLTLGDFNGDGTLDIAGDFQGTNHFQIMYGVGNGTFGIASIPSVGNCGSAIYPVSFNYNGDHRSDLAALCGSSNLTILVGSPPPAITQVAPPSAAAGGSTILLTLTGTSFQNGDTLTWTPVGGSPSTGIPAVFNSNGTLSVTITGSLATTLLASQGPVKLDIVDPSGVSSASPAANFTVAPPPAITGLTPSSAPAGSSSPVSVAISGANFVSGDCVTWTQVTPTAAAPVSLTGTAPCATTVSSSGGQQQLTVQVPTNLLNLVGTANINVIDPDGAPAATPQTFSIVAPTVSGLADSTGAVLTSVGTASSDFSLTINGTNFVTSVSGNTGSVVVFTDPTGASHTLTPSGTGVAPTQITVTVPGADIGNIANATAKVQVLNQAAGGSCTGPGVTGACSNQVTLSIGSPKITAVSPAAAVTGGADLPVTVTGANFVANSQLVWCNNCGGTPQQSITPANVTPGQMMLTIPASLLKAAGTAEISVTNVPGTFTNTNVDSPNLAFSISTLGISTISPTSVIAGGPAFTLTINGQNSNFDNGAEVLFGNGLTPIVASQQAGATITSNQIIITVPASYIATAGSLAIQVQNSSGTQTPAIQLPVNTFAITSVTPLSLVAGGPDSVLTISGTGFGAPSTMQFQWLEGTTTSTLTVLSNAAGQFTVKVPGGSSGLLAQPGSAQIIAQQAIGGSNITTTFGQPVTVSGPVVGSLNPTSAAVNGNAFLLTVTGSNFLTTSVVQWTDSTGKVTPLNTNFQSSTVLTAFVPSSPLLTVASAQTALVTVTNGTVSSNGVVFQIGSVPTILTNGSGLALCTSISNCQPASTITAGSPVTTLQVTGTNFQSGAVVIWAANGTNTNLVTAFQSAISLIAIVPASLLASPTAALLTVQDPGPPITTSNGVLFTVGTGTTPTLATVTAVGNVIIGSPIQLALTGSNFANGAQVQWNNGTTTTGLATVFVDANDLTAVVPANLVTAPATVAITVQSAGATSNQKPFTIPPITITGLSPATATTGSGPLSMTVSGGNFTSTSMVQWTGGAGPVTLATTFVSPNQLTAIVPNAQLLTPGTAFVSVTASSLTTNALPFSVTAAASTAPTIFTDGTGLAICPGGANCKAGNSAVAGSASLVLQVAGLNYQAGSVAIWTAGGTATNLATSFLFPAGTNPNPTLQAVVPATLLASPGTALITVQNPDKTLSNGVLFAIGTGATPTLTMVTAVGPVVLGSAIQLAITGTNFTPGSQAEWNNGTATTPLVTSFIDATDLSATVPANLVSAPATVEITVLSGGATSAPSPFTIPSITISSLGTNSATAGSAAIQLTVNGGNFNATSVVQWNTGTTPTPLATTLISNTQLAALVPATLLANAGTAFVSVTTGTLISNSLPFTIQSPNPPAITTLNPNSAQAGAQGTQITIVGTGFVNGSTAQWNGGGTPTALTTAFVSSSQLTALIPATLIATQATVFISVVNPAGGGTSNLVAFSVLTPTGPSLSSTNGLAPNSAVAGAAAIQLTVNGANFTASSVVQWNASGTPTPLATTLVSNTQLAALVPATLLANAGTAFVSVITGSTASNALPFTIAAPTAPAIGTLSVSTVQAGSQGFQLTIIGTGFVNGAVAQWNAAGTPQALTTAFVSSTQLTALIPTTLLAAPTNAFINVQNPSGGGSSNLVAFAVTAALGPTISTTNGLAPASAATGSTSVTLTVTGANFVNGAVVQWNAGTATPLVTGFVSSSQLTALIPASLLTTPATALIQVQNPDKTVSNSLPFTVSGPGPVTTPTLTSIAPTSAAAGSATLQLTVTGTNFVGPSSSSAGTVVLWNGSAIPTTFGSATQLTATVDTSLLQSIGANFVTVSTGTSSSSGVKFQVSGPTLTAIAPATITAGGPDFNLVLTGTNFVTGSVVVWNTTNLATAVNSATQMTAQVPASLIAQAGTAFITGANPGGATTSPQILTISAPPASGVTTLTPASAIAGSSAFQLTVAGTGFVSGSVVMWNGSPLATGFVSATQITALIDASLIATAGSANVAVQNPGAPLSAAVKFAINGPTATTLTPATANAGDPGFTLTVAGTNFVAGATVSWNGTPLPTIFSTATQLQAIVATSLIASSGTASVNVANPGGAVSGSLLFTIGPPSLKITTTSLPDGLVGTAYSQVLVAQGGTLPYTWTVSAGALAGGLALDPGSGTLSGTPTGAANGTLGFTVTDAVGRVAKQSLQLNIALVLTITTVSPLPVATAGTAYSNTLAATGGTPSYLWSIAGNLPPGLTFNVATGRISGVPTAPGAYTFTIGVTDSRQQQNVTATFTLPVTVAALNVTGLAANVGPAQQVPLTVSILSPYTVDLTGTLTLTFASAVGGDDPSIQFSTVGRTVTFTIPAGTTNAVYPQNAQLLVSTGTLAGTITIKATLQSAGSDITPANLTPVTAAIAKLVPVITSATLKQTTGGVVISISGYSTTKEVTQAALVFNAATGGTLNGGTVTVPLSATIASWYQSAAAAAFGSQFTVNVPIAVSGTVNAIGSVTITLTNTQGNSAPVTAQLQ